MTAALFLLLAVAGGAGAASRLLVDGAVRARFGTRLPWGSTLINVSGSLLLGLLMGLTAEEALPAAWELVLGTGFLGGYTTFSTASFETVRLLQAGRWQASLAVAFGVLLLSVGAALAGYRIGLAL